MQVLGLNALDLLLILIVFIGILVGFVRGVGPQLMSAASIWLGLLVSLWLYKLLSINIFQESDIFGSTSSDAMAFLSLFIVFFHGIRLIVRYLTKPPEERKKKRRRHGQVGPIEEPPPSPVQRFVIGPTQAVGAMAMGFVLIVLWSAILLGVLQFFLQVDVTEVTGVDVPGRGLAAQLRTSTLLPYFNRVLWYLVQSLDLFVLDENADILKRVVCTVFPDSCF
jgi:hypothetical protein